MLFGPFVEFVCFGSRSPIERSLASRRAGPTKAARKHPVHIPAGNFHFPISPSKLSHATASSGRQLLDVWPDRWRAGGFSSDFRSMQQVIDRRALAVNRPTSLKCRVPPRPRGRCSRVRMQKALAWD